MRIPFRTAVLAIAALLLPCALPATAQVQSVTPPVFSGLDGVGVDAATGFYHVTSNEVTIGNPGAGGLNHSRRWFSTGWRDNLAGTIAWDGIIKITVSIGSSSETFSLISGSYIPDQDSASTLTLNSNVYTYTLGDGSVALFDKSLGDSGGVTNFWTANEALITTLTKPDGEEITWHYKTASYSGSTARRPQSISNNLNYQLHFTYANNNPTSPAEFADWLVRTKVTGINRVHYSGCGYTDDTCADSTGANWPYVEYSSYSMGPTGTAEVVTNRLDEDYTYIIDPNGKMIGLTTPEDTANWSHRIEYKTSSFQVDKIYRDNVLYMNYGYVDFSTYRLTTITDQDGVQRRVKSALPEGWVLEVCANAGCTRKTTYDRDTSTGQVDKVTGPAGDYVEYEYDARGNVTETTWTPTLGTPIVTSAEYDATCSNPKTCNQPNSTTDARGFKTDYIYYAAHGGVESVTLPAPAGSAPYGSGTRPKTNYSYAQSGDVYRLASIKSCATTASCANGADEVVTEFGYGDNRLPTSVTSRSGDSGITSTIAMTLTPQGDIATIDGPLSGAADTSYVYYDAMRRNRATVSPDPDGGGALQHRVVRTTYDGDGLPTIVELGYVSAPASWASMSVMQKQTTTYDGWKRASSALSEGRTVPSGPFDKFAMTQFAYTAGSRVECSSVRMNPAVFSYTPITSACVATTVGQFGPDRMSKSEYDSYGVLDALKIGLPGSTITDFSLTPTVSGQVEYATDAEGNETKYEYDGFDRVVKRLYPSTTTPGQQNSSDYEEIAYDTYGRLASSRRRDGTTITYSYDNLGRVTFADLPGTGLDTTYTYDLLGRQTGESQTGTSITRQYDALGRIVSETQPMGTVSYQYDAASRRTRLTWPDTGFVTYEYNTLDEMTAIKEFGETTVYAIAYDNLGRPIETGFENGGAQQYSYDGISRLSTQTIDATTGGATNDRSVTFAYNPASQIVSKSNDNDSYKWMGDAAYTDNYVPDGLNRYTTVAGQTTSFDNNQNMTDDGAGTYGFDVLNRLVSASGGATAEYDASGRLFKVTSGTTSTRFLYDGARLIAEFDNTGAVSARYLHGPGVDNPVVWYQGETVLDRHRLYKDERGSIVGVETNTTYDVNLYDEYGVPDSSNTGRFQYTGQVWLPEFGLYYYKARVYNSEIGRFMQTDPIGYSDGMNLYAYVGGDPINLADPTGLGCTGSIIAATDCSDVPFLQDPPGPGGRFSELGEADGDYKPSICAVSPIRGFFCTPEIVTVRPPYVNPFGNLTADQLLFANVRQFAELTFEVTVFDAEACTQGTGLDCGIEAITAFPGFKLVKIACGCFVEGTLVETPDGLRPIEEIEVGDLVVAWDEETGLVEARAVTRLIRPDPRLIYRLSVTNADEEIVSFEVTDDHPWYVENVGWTETIQLMPGQRIKTADGRGLVVREVAATDRMERSYNLTVDGLHTFLIGADGAVVHNANRCALLASTALQSGVVKTPGVMPLVNVDLAFARTAVGIERVGSIHQSRLAQRVQGGVQLLKQFVKGDLF